MSTDIATRVVRLDRELFLFNFKTIHAFFRLLGLFFRFEVYESDIPWSFFFFVHDNHASKDRTEFIKEGNKIRLVKLIWQPRNKDTCLGVVSGPRFRDLDLNLLISEFLRFHSGHGLRKFSTTSEAHWCVSKTLVGCLLLTRDQSLQRLQFKFFCHFFKLFLRNIFRQVAQEKREFFGLRAFWLRLRGFNHPY